MLNANIISIILNYPGSDALMYREIYLIGKCDELFRDMKPIVTPAWTTARHT